jgi:hypothetical protein
LLFICDAIYVKELLRTQDLNFTKKYIYCAVMLNKCYYTFFSLSQECRATVRQVTGAGPDQDPGIAAREAGLDSVRRRRPGESGRGPEAKMTA